MKKVDRLAELFRIDHYDLTLKLDKKKMSFSGLVEINGEVKKPTRTIKLHSHGLDIQSAKFSIGGAMHNAKKIYHLDNDELQIDFTTDIQKEVKLVIEYKGKITEPMVGIYPSSFELNGKKKTILSTQFESHHAREAFPCIDEPSAKSTFDLTLHTDQGETVLSNTPIKEQKEEGSVLITAFQTTPIMSTYLLAFVVGELKYVERKSETGVVVRTWATPENVQHTDFTLDVAVKCIDFYNDFFGIPYPLEKCDNVAIPDFAAGAMENWGLVTYRESALLVDPANTSLPQKQYVALVVAHELAHQWFGNLVTMQWWTDLWLNEGFASWVEYLAIDKIFPEWEMWTEFVVDDYLRGQSLDSLANTHPVEVNVDNPEEIRSIFDAISYSKGASIVRMLYAYMGHEDFKNGLQHYLKRHSYDNASTADLWRALEEISEKPVTKFMGAWTSQAGFPLLDVDDSDEKTSFKQTRYMISPSERANAQDDSVWPIPIDLTDSDKTYLLDASKKSWKIDLSATPKFNTDQTGFFITSYSSKYLAKLGTKVKKGQLSPLDRLGLLNDSFQLAKAGFKPTVDALKLLEKYSSEDSSAVWDVIAGQLGHIRKIMDSDDLRSAMKPFSAKLAANQLERLGWDESTSDSHFDKLLRPTILSLSSFGEVDSVVAKAKSVFRSAKSIDDIEPNIRGIVIGTTVREGGKKDFEKLLNMYSQTSSAQAKTALAAGLTGFKQPALIAESLNLIKSDQVKLQEVIYWISFSFSNRHAKHVTWTWLKDNWDWLTKQFGTDIMTFTYFPRMASSSFATKEFATEFRKFFDSVDTTGIRRSVYQGLESILWHAEWKDRDEQKVIEYLREQNT